MNNEEKKDVKIETKAEDTKVEAKPEAGKKEEVTIGWTVEGEFLVCKVPINNPHVAMGITFDFLMDIRERLAMARLMQEKRRQELAGKGTLQKGAIQNPSWFKKKFMK